MYPLFELVNMLRRDLSDYQSDWDFSFLEAKVADSAAELSLYLPSLKLVKEDETYYLEEEPIEPIKRLISLNAAIDILSAEYLTLRKTSERIEEPSLSWSYSVASNVARICLDYLRSKRDDLLNLLSEKDEFTSEYLNLIELIKEKDDLAIS